MRYAIAASALLVVALATPTRAQDKAMDHGHHGSMDHGASASPVPGETQAKGVGVVNSVDAEKGVLNITHEPMPALGWPTMTMDLAATRQVDLSKVKPGEKVDFTLKLGRDKQYRVIEIGPAK